MKIIVDADACPVKGIILDTAEKYNISVIMVTDTSHLLDNISCEIITVDKGRDSADIAIANMVNKGDIAVTQDYGLACMLMAKGSHVINQNGFIYTNENRFSAYAQTHLIKTKTRRKKKRAYKAENSCRQ